MISLFVECVHSILYLLQAIDHIINSAAKSNYMSAGQISVPIVFRGPNGAAAGVGAQHSQVCYLFSNFGSFCSHVSISIVMDCLRIIPLKCFLTFC